MWEMAESSILQNHHQTHHIKNLDAVLPPFLSQKQYMRLLFTWKFSLYLQHKVPASEVGDGARQARASPHKAQKQGPLGSGELVHHFPEPLNQRRCRLDAFVGGDGLQQR